MSTCSVIRSPTVGCLWRGLVAVNMHNFDHIDHVYVEVDGLCDTHIRVVGRNQEAPGSLGMRLNIAKCYYTYYILLLLLS